MAQYRSAEVLELFQRLPVLVPDRRQQGVADLRQSRQRFLRAEADDIVDQRRMRQHAVPAIEDKGVPQAGLQRERSEEHTSELQSLMRISYAVFCLKKKKINNR